MTEIPVMAELNCETGEVIERPFTEKELADLEVRRKEAAEKWAAKEAEEEKINALKLSAKAKLIAGEPLTEEEAATIVL